MNMDFNRLSRGVLFSLSAVYAAMVGYILMGAVAATASDKQLRDIHTELQTQLENTGLSTTFVRFYKDSAFNAASTEYGWPLYIGEQKVTAVMDSDTGRLQCEVTQTGGFLGLFKGEKKYSAGCPFTKTI